MDLKRYSMYFLLGLILILGLASYNLLSSLLGAIFGSIILSTILYPLYKKINKKIKNENVSVSIILLLLTLLLIIPSFFLVTSLIRESISAYNFISNVDLTALSKEVEKFLGISFDLNKYVKEGIQGFAVFIINQSRAILSQIVSSIIYVFVVLFLMFYMIRDGDKISRDLDKYIPLKKEQKSKIISHLKETINGVVFGTIVTSLFQGIIGAIGFFLFGIPNAILWGLLIFITGILPVIGASVIYIPAALYLAITSSTTAGILMFLYGMLIISSIETFLKPKIIGSRSKVHPIVILLGLFGGIKVWGLLGVVIGPLILSILFTLITMFDQMYISKQDSKN